MESVGGTRGRWPKAFFFFFFRVGHIVYHPFLDGSMPVRLCAVNVTHPELQVSDLPFCDEARRHAHAFGVWNRPVR